MSSSPHPAQPLVLAVVVLQQSEMVTARYHHQRGLVRRHVFQTGEHQERARVGVRIVGKVLVPAHLVPAPCPLEVDQRLTELDVGADEVRREVGE